MSTAVPWYDAALGGFGFHTVEPDGSIHPGVDLADPAGTPVTSLLPGTITLAGNPAGGGDQVNELIQLPDGSQIVEVFAHLANLVVSVGQQVTGGQMLGVVTGGQNVTNHALWSGPHLHFEVDQNNAAINPVPFLPAGPAGSPLPGAGLFFNSFPGSQVSPGSIGSGAPTLPGVNVPGIINGIVSGVGARSPRDLLIRTGLLALGGLILLIGIIVLFQPAGQKAATVVVPLATKAATA